MIPEQVKKTIQSSYSTFLKANALVARRGQRQMIADIARYLFERDAEGETDDSDNVCVIEAGTGTGKTLAYLAAAIPCAQYLEKNLIISTATITLQEQLVEKDLPDFRDHSGLQFNFTLAKGRGRYLCVARLEGLLAQTEGQDDMFAGQTTELSNTKTISQDVLQQLFKQYASFAWNGELDQLNIALDEGDWLQLISDNRSCANRACSHFSHCPYFRARTEWGKVDVLVCNHDLVLADLALGGGVILPETEETIFVFDEAHHLADKALNHFSQQMYLSATRQWLKQGSKSLVEFNRYLLGRPDLQTAIDQIGSMTREIDQQLDELIDYLIKQIEWPEQPGPLVHRFPNGELPATLTSLSLNLQTSFAATTVEFAKLHAELKKALSDDVNVSADLIAREDAERWYPVIGSLYQRCESGAEFWKLLNCVTGDEKRPVAKWITKRVNEEYLEFICAASPIVADTLLRTGLWKRAYGVVLTSATLSSGNNFSAFCFKNGLTETSFFRLLASPFDYPAISELEIPRDIADPTKTDAHTKAVVDFVLQSIEGSRQQTAKRVADGQAQTAGTGMLVLFSSRKQMNDVYFDLDRDVRNYIVRQDDMNKSEVIRRHREKVDAGEHSTLFGLASFAEGLDLPGNYLTHVVIAKIPFSVPDDPLDAALSEWIESRGGNPFIELTLPQAAVRLKQGCGRLIRNEKDHGKISLLDNRMVTRRYGKYLMDSLPPFRFRTD
ncbi:MAG: ATP-dependent DNA helicase DinG [Gammaproteobacteria bacterium]|nr:MAG: ATP-dependent DNA helicase DinG [Gammaproteobacteria bacterium]